MHRSLQGQTPGSDIPGPSPSLLNSASLCTETHFPQIPNIASRFCAGQRGMHKLGYSLCPGSRWRQQGGTSAPAVRDTLQIPHPPTHTHTHTRTHAHAHAHAHTHTRTHTRTRTRTNLKSLCLATAGSGIALTQSDAGEESSSPRAQTLTTFRKRQRQEVGSCRRFGRSPATSVTTFCLVRKSGRKGEQIWTRRTVKCFQGKAGEVGALLGKRGSS